MEVSGVVSRHVHGFSRVEIEAKSSNWENRLLGRRDFGVSFRPRRLPGAMKTEFCDKGHMEYYYKVGQTPRCGGVGEKKKKNKDQVKEMEKEKEKKKLKLLKGLSKNLSMFADIDFGLNPQAQDNPVVSEAVDVLLKQLEELRAEEKELKRRRKEEKAKLKAARMAGMNNGESSSSSSSESSESSDSECDEVVDMNQMRTEPISQLVQDHNIQLVPQEAAKLPQSLPSSLTTNLTEELNCESGTLSTSISCGFSNVEHVNGGGLSSKRVEVCMGNKCRKSGGAALIEEFEKVMGAEGAVVGCKCMGKCKSGPNVRVLNSIADESVRTTTSPLCIGVGLEDVNLIMANLLGEDTTDLGLAAAV